MSNKKAIELSLNFIVIIIISIIIFGFGVKFIYNLSSKAKHITEYTLSELDERVKDIICGGYDRICVDIDHKTIKRKNHNFFELEIVNIFNNQEFTIIVSPPSDKLGIRKDKTDIGPNEPHLIINPPVRTITLKKNEERGIVLGVEVPADAVSGTYILNLEIKTNIKQPDGSYKYNYYVPIQKLYVDVP